MKIVVDIQGVQTASRQRGIGRYSLGLAKALIRHKKDHDLYILLNHAFSEELEEVRATFRGLIEEDKILVYQGLRHTAEGCSANQPRARASEVVRETYLESLQPEFVLVSSLFEGWLDDATTSIGRHTHIPTGAILYDIIPFLNPDQYLPTPEIKTWYDQKVESLKRAEILFAISESAKQEALEHLKLPSNQIEVVYADSFTTFKKKPSAEVEHEIGKYGIQDKFILCTGVVAGEDPRKNIANLIKAYSLLSPSLQNEFQLVFAGDVTEPNKLRWISFAKAHGLCGDRLVFTHHVKDEVLASLYNACELLVLPSLHEGFGLPALEAMRCGSPAIGSNCSSIPEVIGCSGGIFDPHDPQDISQKIDEALTNKKFRKTLLEIGKKQSNFFSWDKIGKQIISSIEKYEGGLSTERESFESCLPALAKIEGLAEADLVSISQALIENDPNENKQLLVDITELVQRDAGTGIQRVVNKVVSSLMKKEKLNGYSVKLVYRRDLTYFYANQFMNTRFLKNSEFLEDDVVDFGPNDIFIGLDLDIIGLQYDPVRDLLLHHKQRGMKLYFVVYDMLPVLHPEWFIADMHLPFVHWIHTLTNIADGLICISQAVGHEVFQWCQGHPRQRHDDLKIGYFHLGADIKSHQNPERLSKEDKEVLRKLESRDVTLMVGTVEPRKGHDQALEAFERLWEEGEDKALFIVGKSGWNVEELSRRLETHPELNKKLFWYDKVSDELLLQLYGHSQVILMASRGEGYGLPLIEAAHHELPIIARDLPVFREIGGVHASYFSSETGEGLADHIREWYRLFEKNQHPKSDGLSYLSWEESTNQLMDRIFEGQWMYPADESEHIDQGDCMKGFRTYCS